MRLLIIFASLMAIFAAEFASARSSGPKFNTGPAPFPIQVAVLRANGSGCPNGSVAASLSPDQSTVSILFDKMGTQLQASPAAVSDQKTCTITLGVKFGGQYRVAIIGSDLRGFASVPAQASSVISVKHQSIYTFGQDIKYMNFQKNLVGPTEQNIFMQNRFSQRPLWSECGTQMKYNTQIFPFMFITIDISAKNQNASENLQAFVDSLDVSAAPLSYQIAWVADTQSCPN